MPARKASAGCLLAALLSVALAPEVRAHALLQGTLEVVVHPAAAPAGGARVTVAARVPVEELCVAAGIAPGDEGRLDAAGLRQAAAEHGAYLAERLRVTVDDRPMCGAVVRPGALALPVAGPTYRWAEQNFVEYGLEYREEGTERAGEGPKQRGPVPHGDESATAAPAIVKLRQDVLQGATYRGQTWVTHFVVRIREDTSPTFHAYLLWAGPPVIHRCDWSVSSAASPAPTGPVAAGNTRLDLWPTVRDYGWAGVRHILTGYDHLLFVTALVLATTRLWDLVKVVSAFTLAHTLTLTLSVLDVVRLPASVVEPVIAASIVLVALENVLWPRRSRGWLRLAVAFTFGLFHGLGFAGGLLEAMAGMPALNLGTALAAFSAGVEVGHQVVVLPVFALLALIRHYHAGDQPRVAFSRFAQRYGSAAISLAGVWFLIVALRG